MVQFFRFVLLFCLTLSLLASKPEKPSKPEKNYELSQCLKAYYNQKWEQSKNLLLQYIHKYGESVVPLRYLALIEYRSKHKDKAITYLKKTVSMVDVDIDTLDLLAHIYFAEKNYTEAKTVFLRMEEIDPLHVDTLYYLGLIYDIEKQLSRAIYYLKRTEIIAQQQGDTTVLYGIYAYLSDYYYKKDNYQGALEYYQKMLKINPTEWKIIHALSGLYKIRGRFQDSALMSKKILAKFPSHVESMKSLVEIYYISGNSRVYALSKKILAMSTKDSLLVRAILAELDNNLDEAESLFHQLIKKHPYWLSPHIGLLKVYVAKNDLQKVIQQRFFIAHLAQKVSGYKLAERNMLAIFDILEKQKKDNNWYRQWQQGKKIDEQGLKDLLNIFYLYQNACLEYGDLLSQRHRYQHSLAYYRVGLQYGKYIVNMHNNYPDLFGKMEKKDTLFVTSKQRSYILRMHLGWNLQQGSHKQTELAMIEFKKLVWLYPDRPEPVFLLGVLYYQLADDKKNEYYSMAIENIQNAIALAKSNKLSANYYFYLGMCFEKIGQFEQAEVQIKKALDLDTKNGNYLNYLGYLYLLRDIKYEDAHKLLSNALEVEPANEAYLDSFGWLLYKRKLYNQALSQLLLASHISENKNQKDAVIYFHLAETYYKLELYHMSHMYFVRTLMFVSNASEKLDKIYIQKRINTLRKQYYQYDVNNKVVSQ